MLKDIWRERAEKQLLSGCVSLRMAERRHMILGMMQVSVGLHESEDRSGMTR